MDPRYPVGKFVWPEKVSEEERKQFIGQIEDAPAKLRAAVSGLTEAQSTRPIARVVGRCGKWRTTWPTATCIPTSGSSRRLPKTSRP